MGFVQSCEKIREERQKSVAEVTLPNRFIYSSLLNQSQNKSMKVRDAFLVQFGEVANPFRDSKGYMEKCQQSKYISYSPSTQFCITNTA